MDCRTEHNGPGLMSLLDVGREVGCFHSILEGTSFLGRGWVEGHALL